MFCDIAVKIRSSLLAGSRLPYMDHVDMTLAVLRFFQPSCKKNKLINIFRRISPVADFFHGKINEEDTCFKK